MNTKIVKIKGDWLDVLNDCRATVGKSELRKTPSRVFRRAILIAEHSPIRNISFKWRWIDIKSWIATHWSRHKWECYIQTQRTDRTGIDRDALPQSMPVTFTGEANAQHLIDTMRKRLCYQAAAETREYAEDLKAAVTSEDADIGAVLVPNCIYRAGCPELKPCGYYTSFLRWCGEKGYSPNASIAKRYEHYNEFVQEAENE